MSNSSSATEITVSVELAERRYPIHIGLGTLGRLPSRVRELFQENRHAVFIYDENIKPIVDSLLSDFAKEEFRSTLLPVASGEKSKSVSVLDALWQQMLEEHADRGSVVIAVGGGVVGDLAGFAAATFARGLPLIQVPTTLLSQVDSSVGGKTAINLPGAKNIVGAFWQPSLVAIDIETLSTLPEREFLSGLGEVVKYGMILLPELLQFLEQNTDAILARDAKALTHIISESCRAKAMVVTEDERETSGRRAILNYGHTFAHAIESLVGYGVLLHGEAVAIGMHLAAKLAERLGRIDSQLVERQATLLERLHLPLALPATHQNKSLPPLSAEDFWRVMKRDKKVEHGQLRFILPSRLGHVELVRNVPEAEVSELLRAVLADGS